jgi:SAM-dependent methyltransferase
MSCMVCGAAKADPIGTKNGYSLVKCADCSFRFVDPMPSGEVLDAYYGRYWANEKNVRNADRKLRKFGRLLAPLKARKAGQTFLDVGCNIGFGVEAARQLGYTAKGIDLSGDAIERARVLYPQNTFDVAPVQELAASGAAFDAVLCREVVEHLTEIESFFEALAKVTRPGGRLMLTTPDAAHSAVPRDFVEWKEVIPPEHLCFFDQDTLGRMLGRHGFRIARRLFTFKPSLRVIAEKRT